MVSLCTSTLLLVACERLGCMFLQNGTESICKPLDIPRFVFEESVTCGLTLTAETSDDYPAHFYHFELSSDTGMSTVTFDTCSSDYQTWVHLYDENSLTLIQNEEGTANVCGGVQAYMEVYDLANGKYIIRMDGYANEAGTYNLTVNCEDVSIRDYAYVSTPKTYDDAELYCLNVFEENLATIITKNDMIDAITEIKGRDAPWIGLRSVREIGWFMYFDGESCPEESKYYGSCLGKEYWVDGKPKQCGVKCGPQDGSKCVTLYDQPDGSGKVNNDIKCQELRPFLCGKPKITLREYDYSGEWGDWNEAYDYCTDKGGLASFITENDLANLQQTIVSVPTHEEYGVPQYAWIGLAYSTDNNGWEWLDNTQCTSTDDLCTELWNAGEPNGDVLGFNPNTCACRRSGCQKANNCHHTYCARRGCIRSGCTWNICIWGWWGINCICVRTGCLAYGCFETRCVKVCERYGCMDWNCHTNDANCAAAERSSQNANSVGLVADYHCNDDNMAPIICNDNTNVNNGDVEIESNPIMENIVEIEYKPKVIDVSKFVYGLALLLIFLIVYKSINVHIKNKTVSGDADEMEDEV